MAEKQEFYKLINDKTKVPRLTPIPKINLMKSEQVEKNPLQKFRAQALKLVKPRQPKTTDRWKSTFFRISKNYHTEELIKLARAITVQGLLPDWEKNIFKLIPTSSKRKHHSCFDDLIKEVRRDYLEEMQDFSIKNIVKIDDKDSYKKYSKTHIIESITKEELRATYDLNRRNFIRNYFSSHRLIRMISDIMYYNLPKSFFDFDKYNKLEPLHMLKLYEIMKNDLKKNSMIVQNQCYNEIIGCMLQMNNLKNDRRLPKLLYSAESFIEQRILNSKINSINKLIEALSNIGSCAQLKLQLLCRNNNLELEPSIDDIILKYHQLIDNLSDLSKDLVPLGEWLNISGKRRYMKVHLPEWFLEKAHNDLQIVLEMNFQTLSEHYSNVCTRFNTLCSNVTKNQINRLIAQKKEFQVYCAKVSEYNAHLADVNEMVANIYYKYGILSQTSAIIDLKYHTTEIINMLIKELIDSHQELNRSICMEFENLESRALAIPDDTKALFELTDYVSHASKVLVKELEDNIQKSVEMLCSLLEIAQLSNEHIELNKTTINWLELIKPVFSQHNIFCEAKKGELEDELQRKINVLSNEIDAIIPELIIIDDMDDIKHVSDYRGFLAAISKKIEHVEKQVDLINMEEKLFKFPETTFPKVDEIKEVTESFRALINIIYAWKRDYGVWMDGSFEYLDAEVIKNKTIDYFDKITEMHKTFKIKIKSDLTSNKPFKFSGIVDDPDPLQQPAPLKLCWQALQQINDFKKNVSLAVCMCNPALEKRHWDEMSAIAGINLLPNAGTTLKKMISLDLLKDFDKYEVISIGANKELALQKKLNSMIDEWKAVNFSMSISEESGLLMFTEEDRIEIMFEEQFVKIAKMRASYFITPIEMKVTEFYEKLCRIRDTIEYWNCVQKQCNYLEDFFSNHIVEGHLGTELDLYSSLRTILYSIDESLTSKPTFHYITKTKSILENLKKGKYALELINSKVRDYFEQLKRSFTRLFFLSDREIMKLLFHLPNLSHSQSHIRKCFPNIVRLKLDEKLNILSIIGDGGEELSLHKSIPVATDDSITEWLATLNDEIIDMIRQKINDCLENFNNELSLHWISHTPAMVIYCIFQILWTSKIHESFSSSNSDSLKILMDELRYYKQTAKEFLKLNLTRKDREIITSLLILLMNQEEITNLLIEKKVHEVTDFDWKSQVRYYYQEGQVGIMIINTCIKYAYEYYSSNQRITVNTPLTERCYRSLMEAYYQNHFGSIVGFSCTGKIETISNLSRLIAAPFFMFCGEEKHNYNSIGNIFKGLVTLQAWICLKNFTRIKEEILSVIAQYIFRITQSKSMNLTAINIDGMALAFNPDCYFTFSINPAMKNLSNIPDNLKLHFRTVCFMNPDYEKICEVELFAAGFNNSRNLAISLNEVYILCNEQMSSVKKYNFKLINLKSVIKTAGKLKFSYPDEDEGSLLVRALIDSNISQFHERDIIVFKSILAKCFPNVILPPPNYDNLMEAIERICSVEHLSTHDTLKLKVIQLYELIHLQQAIIVVGDSYSGKSTLLHILMESLLFIQEQDNQQSTFKINCEIIYPKALSINRMYGYVDESTGEWVDGICPDILRRFTEDDDSKKKWIIFDGDIQSSWIEKLESLLDHNKTLYLTSNEKIILTESTKIFFETSDLQYVSPAIVSRCGIVHVDSKIPGWRPFLLSDIISVDNFRGYEKIIYTSFDWIVDPCLEFIHKHCTVSLVLSDMHLVMSTLNLFKMYMNNAIEENLDKKQEQGGKDYTGLWSQGALIMAVNWALAGCLDYESKMKFEEFFLSLLNNSNENHLRPSEIKQYEVPLPTEGKLEDNIFIFKGLGQWKYYGELMRTEKPKEDSLFRDPFIPTIDSIKFSALLDLHLKYRKPFVIIGESSSGKTSFLQEYLSNLSRSDYVANYMNFNSATESDSIQQLLLSKLNKIKRDNYGPSKGRYFFNFIDDLNVKSDDQSNSTLELIRQYMDYGFWYDLKHMKKVIVSKTIFSAALTTGRERFSKICTRFLRHFQIFTLHPQSKDSIFRIFSNTLLIDLKKNSFSTDVSSSVNNIVNATIEVYLTALEELRQSPSKILYRFSLRDVHRIMKGCGLIQKESVETKITFVRLWAHETYRVMGDRIVNDNDKKLLFTKIRESIKLHFKDTFESVFDHLPKDENDKLSHQSFDDLAFGNFIESEKCKRKYEEVSNSDTLKNKFLQYVKEYNDTNKKKIDIVITCHAIQQLVRICRILATPGGSLLMISSSGSGRKSLTRLAAYIQQHSLFELNLDANYDVSSWRNDIKTIMMNCGTRNIDYTFLITDRQMRPEIIQDIHSLLRYGEISGLFSDDEQRTIIKSVRLDAQRGNRNLEIDSTSVFNYFLNQCKQRIHFIINISPAVNNLSKYLQKYPTLIDQCSINWFDNWTEKSFEQISGYYLKNGSLQEPAKSQIILASKQFYYKAKEISCKHHEETGKVFHVAPSAFVRSMKLYLEIFSKKQEEIKTTRKRYLNGLDKLQLAAREVAQMKNTLTKLRPQLEASARQTEATMKEIENENISVERATVLVKRDEEIANKKAEIAGMLKAECEAELAVAIPILEDALAALNTLKPTDITLVKAMKNPPDTVKLVMAAVCVMLNVASERVVDPITGRKSMDFWGPSKRVLGDMNFLQNLKDYDKDNIAPTIMMTIKKNYMSDKNFMPHIVAKASSAAEGLCKWVRAMVSYDEVAKVVAPKKEKLAAAQKECDETEAFLNAKRKTLADLNMKLAALKGTLEATLLKKLELEQEVENCTIKLKKAEGLIASLGGEKARWVDSATKLERLYNNLAGDVLLSGAMITYLSSLSLEYRERIILEWKEFMKSTNSPFSEEYDFVSFMGVEIKMNSWHLCGLSNNQLSLQNAIIMENSPMWSLFIDPQTQANEWIKNMEKPNDLQILKVTDANYMDIIRRCMEIGTPVLLENLEENLDVALDPILARDIYQISEIWYMDLGQDSVVYRSSFRFYLTTRHHNPNYSSDVFNKVTVTDFLLPSDALRDRLLDIVISRERPELQEKFEKILVENINIKRILKQQEDNILHTLSSSSANILEDESAIKILDSSKSLAVDLMKRQEATRLTKEEIDNFRETYSQFTKYCADLYSTLNLLPNLNFMYRFSLSWFTQLYIKSIETSNRSVIHKRRIDYLKMSSIQNLHQSVHTALFEKHKLIYSFILTAKTLLDTEQVSEQEFNIFMSINSKTSRKYNDDIGPNPAAWLPDNSWREICRVTSLLPVFQNFTNSFVTNNTKWRRYCNSIENDDCLMPTPWDNKLSQFQKLIIIRILCPDKIIFKVTEFVESVMGQSSSSFIPCNISRPYQESSCLTPLIFILPSYSPPFTIVNKLAKNLGYSSKLHSLSMGPSQGQKAELLIEIAREKGEWVFLHNCHLALPWMMKLEKICEKFNVTNTAVGFRLWMSTESSNKFPIGILQNSIKIAFDFPQDVKQTLTWTYKLEPVRDKEFFEGCPGKDKPFTKLLYGVCLLHAVIRERRNFGLQSWNLSYDFDESDLQMSIIQLKTWINQCDKVPFKALTYFLSECNYGGKILDIQDKIYLDTLVADFCNYKVIGDSNYDFDTVNSYRVPKRIEYKDYMKHIRTSIPNYTSPEDFGLDKNVALIKNNNKVKVFLDSLMSLNETTVIHDDEIKNNRVELIVTDTLKVIPGNFDIRQVQDKYKINDSEPLNGVLIEEIELHNTCLDTIRNSLLELKRAYSGYLIWTDRLEEISEEIFQGLVPKSWKIHISLCTIKILTKFIKHILERIEFIKNWINNGHPRLYWFGGLMSCKKLLSALKMKYAREKQVPIDQIAFEYNVLETKDPTSDYDMPENSICVYGLYLIGARWNDQKLNDSRTKIFYNEMPIICFELTIKKNTNSTNTYKCPLYVTPSIHNSPQNSENSLDNYILSINLKSDVNPKTWIKRGTALYCQIE